MGPGFFLDAFPADVDETPAFVLTAVSPLMRLFFPSRTGLRLRVLARLSGSELGSSPSSEIEGGEPRRLDLLK